MKALMITTSVGTYVAFPEDATSKPIPVELGIHERQRCPLVFDADDPSLCWLATHRKGVFRSTDGGQTWKECSKGLTYQEVWFLEQHPLSGELYIGTGPVALFRSTDKGETWEEFENLTRAPFKADWLCHVAPFHPRARSITFSTEDPGFLMIAVEEGWLVRTSDDGNSWTNSREGLGQDAHMVTIMPGQSDVVLCATGTGIFRSIDQGVSFSSIDGINRTYVTAILAHRGCPHLVFAATSKRSPRDWHPGRAGADFRLLRSDDDGLNWSELDSGWPANTSAGCHGAVVFDPDDSDVFFVGLSDGSIWRTTDGKIFSPFATDLPHISGLAITNLTSEHFSRQQS